SFRLSADINTSGWWTVFTNLGSNEWTLSNYTEVLDRAGFGNAFLNSLAVTIPSTVIPITIAAFAAYGFAWTEFRGRNVLFILVVALLVVPLQMALIPILRLYTSGGHLAIWALFAIFAAATVFAAYFLVRGKGGLIPLIVFGVLALGVALLWMSGTTEVTVFPDLDLNGTFLAVWLAHTGFGLPLAVYLLRNYMGSLPSSIVESAEIDGADHFMIFTRLVIPLSVPVLASFAIFQFLWVWNDLLIAIIFLGGEPQNRVITQALMELNSARGNEWQLLTAGAFISMALPVAVFFALQRFFVRGLTAGSVKG
ncbi:MAG: carbohydrate ABC transporter permease, partial [Actinomycetota bacterium]|nr:carbohydrate ABC transporter permease [Actinomycetota bacterium]